MNPRAGHPPSSRAIWLWVLFGLLACLHGSAASPVSPVTLGPAYVVPLLTAWVAYGHGWRVVSLLLSLAFPAALGLHLQLTDFIAVSYGLPLDAYLLAIGAALAFVAPPPRRSPTGLVRPWWHWSLLCGAVVLWSVARFDWHITLPMCDRGRLTLSPLPAVLAVPLLTFRCREMLAWARDHGVGPGVVPAALGLAVLVLGVRAELFVVPLAASFGGGPSAASLILNAGAFLVAASGIYDWRRLAGVLGPLLALELLFAFEPGVVASISAVLLGAALGPFWRSRGERGVAAGRAAAFLLALLALQAFALPVSYEPLVTGGIAFLGGLVWRFRGLLALPAALGLLYAARLLTTVEKLEPMDLILAVLLAPIGFHAFVFAFFGLLASRFSLSPQAREAAA